MIEKIETNIPATVRPVLKEAFGWPGYLAAYDQGKATFGFFDDNTVIGVIVCGLIETKTSGRIGIVKYVATKKQAQGKGAASALTEEALRWFETQGCREVAACVEGYNTASAQLFEKRGFHPRPFLWQLRRYRWQLPKVWLMSNHFFDMGHFWWSKSDDTQESSCLKPQGLWMWVVTFFLFMGFLLRQSVPLDIQTLGSVGIGLFLLTLMRFGPIYWMAKRLDYPLVYKGWETSLLLSAFVLWVTGGIFYAPGGLYPDKPGWREDEERDLLATLHVPGLIGLWLLHIFVFSVLYFSPGLDRFASELSLIFFMVSFAVMFDAWFAFFPVDSMAGGRVRKHYPKLWLMIAVSSVGLFIVASLL